MLTLDDLIEDELYEDGIPIDEIPYEHAKIIQQALTDSGRPVAVDGIVGYQTKSNWMAFKQANHQRYPELVGAGSLKILRSSIKENIAPEVNPKNHIFYELTPIRKVFLDLIAYCEGTDMILDTTPTGYDIRYSYVRFKDFSKFPAGRITANGITSSASGRYQIMDFTWKEIQRALNFPSFEPRYQDQACLWLIHVKRNALRYVDKGNLEDFLEICSWEWASLPPNRYGQPVKTCEEVRRLYKKLRDIHL